MRDDKQSRLPGVIALSFAGTESDVSERPCVAIERIAVPRDPRKFMIVVPYSDFKAV
jgi:hypothetical protein